jgi:endonuclease YncB( thermonuclease family)
MAKASTLIAVGAVAAVAAGGATYLFLQQQPAAPPAAAPAPAPVSPPAASAPPPAASTPAPAAPTASTEPPAANPPAAATPPAPDASANTAEQETGGVAAPDVASVEFSSLIQPFSLTRDSAAYVAASNDAPQMYPLRAGTPLQSTEKSKDGKWVIALTVDGQAAYLPAADLGPYDPSKVPQPELPATVSGPATVLDTGTLQVGDQKITLAGVKGETGDYATDLQKLITAQGPQVTCTLQGQAYVCTLPTGLDIARTALYNGAADIGDDASDDYQQQVAAAKEAHRGIWR